LALNELFELKMKLYSALSHLLIQCLFNHAESITAHHSLRGIENRVLDADWIILEDDEFSKQLMFSASMPVTITNPPTESVTDPVTDAPTNPPTESVTDPVTDAPTEKGTDPYCDEIEAANELEYNEKIETIFKGISGENAFDENDSDRSAALDFIRNEQFCAEEAALVQRYISALFYYATDGENWTDASNWLSSSHECDWGSINCDTESQTIRILSNDNNNLGGTIPFEVCFLPFLTTIDLDSNQIGGALPDSIGDCSNLKTIDVDNNVMIGTIPASLYSIQGLEKIDIDNNQFSGTISAEISSLTNLNFLAMHKNIFTGTIPTEIANLGQLKVAYFDGNEFTGTMPAEVCALVDNSLGSLTSDCSGTPPEVECNCCTGCGPSFCDEIGAATELEYNENIETILKGISGDNAFDENDSDRSAALDFIRNEQFCAEEAAIVQRYISALFYFATDGENWADASNWLSSSHECDWGKTFCVDLEITVLNNDENGLGGTLPFEICDLPSLEAIDLDSNNIGGSIPESIGDCQNLINFDIDRNSLTGTIPESLYSITGLKNIDLDNNNLQGPLSNDIGNLEDLENLSLWENSLTGTIPMSIANLENLGVVYLDTNEFTGVMPVEVCPLRDIQLSSLVVDCSVECSCCTDYCA